MAEIFGTKGALGVATNGDDSESGLLVTENPQAGKIPAKGWVKSP